MTIPITIIGGYLGAGKTTLINRVLQSAEDLQGLAVLVNDFGDVNVDAELIRAKSPDGHVLALSNGCVCCSIQDDFTQTLESLRTRDIKHILFEASGVAAPAKLYAQCHYPGFEPRGCVVLIDATQFQRQAQDKYVGHLVKQQAAEADLLVLTKTSESPGFNSPDASRSIDSSDSRLLDLLLDATAPLPQVATRQTIEPPTFATVTLRQHRPIARAQLERLLASLPATVVRVKGFAQTEEGMVLVQKTGDAVELTPAAADARGELVFIAYPETHYPLNEWEAWRTTAARATSRSHSRD